MIIAASDSAACAGIQADIRTCAALRTRATTVVTAVTAQNSLHMKAITPIRADMVRLQMECAAEQVRPHAIKIGLLPDEEAIYAVASGLRKLDLTENIVVDTVAAPTACGEFFSKEYATLWCRAMTDHLFPLCKIATPNLPELKLLGGDYAAGELRALWGCPYLLVKGGHNDDISCVQDTLWCHDRVRPLRFTSERINTRHLRGTGCTLSSAIACYLASGYPVVEAVKKAHDFLQYRIRATSLQIKATNNESVI